MERVDYDPEIDPSIREAQEEAEREREMSERIRAEIDRYVRENNLVPKEKPDGGRDVDGEQGTDDGDTGKRIRRGRKAAEREEKQEEKRKKRAKRAEGGRRAFQSVFTGSILSNPQIVKLLPYMIGIAVLLMLYIANIFHLQTLHRQQQRLDEEIRELGIKAVGYSAERAQQTKRSAIVRRLEEENIPLKEFPQPLKTIDPK